MKFVYNYPLYVIVGALCLIAFLIELPILGAIILAILLIFVFFLHRNERRERNFLEVLKKSEPIEGELPDTLYVSHEFSIAYHDILERELNSDKRRLRL